MQRKVGQPPVPLERGGGSLLDGLGRPSPHKHAYVGWTLRLNFLQTFQSILFQSILVRTRERISMKTVISNNPQDAPEIVWARLGRMEKRP